LQFGPLGLKLHLWLAPGRHRDHLPAHVTTVDSEAAVTPPIPGHFKEQIFREVLGTFRILFDFALIPLLFSRRFF